MLLLGTLFMAMTVVGTYVTLHLIIRSEEPIIVPDLVGKDVLVGLEVLSDLGLNTRVRGTRYHGQVPRNHIIDQEPLPGSAIKRGRDVKIHVSRGPDSIVMPNLVGLSLQQSRILLTENGLCQGTVAGMTSSLTSTGLVMTQYPPPGETVSREACTDLLISQGPPSLAFAMPDLTGIPLEAAIRRLEQLQLSVGPFRAIQRSDAPPQTVVDQMPPTGYRISPGGRVVLSVTSSSSAPPAIDNAAADPAGLFRFTLESGVLKKRVRVKLDTPPASMQLFDDFLAPGQELWLLIPKSGNPSVLVYVDDQLVESRKAGGL